MVKRRRNPGRREGHLLVPIVIVVIAPGKGDVLAVESEDAAIGDGDAMGVALQIGEHVVSSAERRFDVGVPIGFAEASEEEVELRGVGGDRGRQGEGTIGDGRTKGIADQRAEATGEDLDGKEKGEPADADPAAAIEREAAAGDHTMNMRVKDKGLSPGVQHREDAEERPQFRLCNIDDGLSGGVEQDGIEQGRRNERKDVQFVWDGEDGVKVRDVENLVTAGVEPTLTGLGTAGRTVTIAAGVPEHVLVATAVTMIAMTAQGGRAAVGERAHHAELARGKRMQSMELGAFGSDDRAERGLGVHGLRSVASRRVVFVARGDSIEGTPGECG